LHRLYAWALGYFWIPCPLCGRYFGGHEWREVDGKPASVPDSRGGADIGLSIAICPNCTAEGRGHPPRISLADAEHMNRVIEMPDQPNYPDVPIEDET
jgi:hypothetical protein